MSDTRPLVSVVMPVRNESAYIDAALQAVLSQTYPAERMEVLVVDGRSEDDTRDRVRSLAEQAPNHSIQLVDNPGRIAPCALNAGIARARGEIIVRVDGHCAIGPEYVENGVRHLLGGEGAGVGGILETVGETPTARAIAVAMSSRFGVGGSAFRTSASDAPIQSVDTVAFPAYLRTVLDQAGPFDEELVRNQDDEYNYRLRKAGHRILLVPDMPVRYSSRASFRSLFRQFLQYGYWKVRVLQKHPRQMRARQFVPPLFALSLAFPFLAAALVLFSAPFGRYALALSLAPLLIYAATVACTATLEARRRSVAAWRLAPAFVLMHLGYGLGFLGGLVRFAGRWLSP